MPITPKVQRVTIDELDELLADVVTDYTVNKKSLPELQRRIDRHLLPHFRGWRTAAMTKADVVRYVAMRQVERTANEARAWWSGFATAWLLSPIFPNAPTGSHRRVIFWSA